MSKYFFFVALPYVSLIVMLIGSIYRYKYAGFKFSSLSSQFLEGKKLFWGSQPFHWGMMFLFFGHLIGFMFPKTVIAMNGTPLRLVIIEITAFGFAICALFGLLMLIRRRITSKRIKVVTTKMDVFVLLVLLLQIGSGMWVAYFSRWGSSWFASTLTPYLWSVFKFNPDMEAIAAMPFAVQLHVVSAFAIIGFIPFTRFVHFLVYPIQYVWRPFQKVIWYWDRKDIRKPDKWMKGVRSKNN